METKKSPSEDVAFSVKSPCLALVRMPARKKKEKERRRGKEEKEEIRTEWRKIAEQG